MQHSWHKQKSDQNGLILLTLWSGEIGTFTDTIERSTNVTRIDSRLRVAVTFLGIVFYRQDSDITEIMHGARLVSLRSVTNRDGVNIEVQGKAEGDQFLVNATAGTFTGPSTISPSDPWVLKGIGAGVVVFTDTGRIIAVHVSGGDQEMVDFGPCAPGEHERAVAGAD